MAQQGARDAAVIVKCFERFPFGWRGRHVKSYAKARGWMMLDNDGEYYDAGIATVQFEFDEDEPSEPIYGVYVVALDPASATVDTYVEALTEELGAPITDGDYTRWTLSDGAVVDVSPFLCGHPAIRIEVDRNKY